MKVEIHLNRIEKRLFFEEHELGEVLTTAKIMAKIPGENRNGTRTSRLIWEGGGKTTTGMVVKGIHASAKATRMLK